MKYHSLYVYALNTQACYMGGSEFNFKEWRGEGKRGVGTKNWIKEGGFRETAK